MAIKINPDMFIEALEDNSFEREYFLDTKTGEIEMLMDSGDLAEDEEIRERIESAADRYIWIEPVGSYKGFRVMEEFVGELPEGDARNDLIDALYRQKPFRGFKDALLNYPDVRENWFSFRNQRFKIMVEEWLEDHGVAAELLPLPGERK